MARAHACWVVSTVLAIGVTGCLGAGADDASERREPGASALGRDVEIVTSDGVAISASFAPAARRRVPAVILLHELRSTREDFAGFAPRLRRRGMATLAIDLRGMGRSLSRSPSKERYVPPRREERLLRLMQRDVEAAVRFLAARPEVDRRRIAIVGIGGGGSLAWRASGSGVRGAVALGPAVPLDAIPPLRSRPPRGVLFATQRLRAALSHELSAATERPKRVVLAHGELGGAGLLVDPAIQREIFAWLERIVS